MSGWIKIHRQLQENPLYFSEPFTRAQAWIDLLLLANHKDGSFIKRGILIEVKCGQVGYSIESLAERWQWSRGKVERFISLLETMKQVVRQKNNVTTLLSIVNYKEYQSDEHQTRKQTDTKRTPNGHQTDTNKNDKNDKNEENSIYRQFDHLKITAQEIAKLEEEGFTRESIDMILDEIENYKGNNKYKSLCATARNWLKKRQQQEIKQGTGKKKKFRIDSPAGSVVKEFTYEELKAFQHSIRNSNGAVTIREEL